MKKAFLLNPNLEAFRVCYTLAGNIEVGESSLIEGACLEKFSKSLGRVPLFNTNSARKQAEEVDFENHRSLFRCRSDDDESKMVIRAQMKDL
jgi:hypothetical protein